MVLVNIFSGQEERCIHREDLWPRREGEGEKNRETRIDIYSLPSVEEIVSGKLLYSTGNSAQCFVTT